MQVPQPSNDNGHVIKSHKWLWASVASLLFYQLLHYATFGNDAARLGVEVLLFGSATAVSTGWTLGALRAFRNGASTDWDKGVLAVWGWWTTMVLQRLYAIVYIGLERPVWLQEQSINGTLTVLFLITAVYAIVAPISSTIMPIEWRKAEQRNLFWSIVVGIVAIILVSLWLWSRSYNIGPF